MEASLFYLSYPGDKVRLSIFSRLVIGYLLLLVLVTGVSIYTVSQLSGVSHITHSIISVDNYLIDDQKKLGDILLSEMRYEKKFLIMKDPELYNGFLQKTGDFEQNVGAAMLLADSTEVRSSLAKIKNFHDSYKMLLSEEVEHLRAGSKSARLQYARERGQIIDGIMAELEILKALGQKNIFKKIKNLDEAVPRSRRISFAMTVASVSFGIILAIYITRTITVPLSEMKKKTAEIASGIFEDNLYLPHPPEIGELAAALNLMCRKLKEVDKMKSDFFSLMSHELRTPLTSIKEGTNLLREGLAGEITARQKKLLTIISEESNRLIELVNSLLDLTKIEAGMMAYSFATAELTPLIQKVILELSPIAESKRLKVERHLEELPMINMDRERILQVLRNLVGNALKFTPNGGLITIAARLTREGAEVSVSDTGPGIPKEHLHNIFDKFRQVGQPNSGNLKGTGLGLAIVRHIIDKHGGKIWIESNAGMGNTFFFVLPV